MKYIPTPEELASGEWVWDDISDTFINKEELLGEPEEIIPDEINQENVTLREAAYRTISDKLFMEWQYDKTRQKELEWRSAVQAIKYKYPLH